MSLCSVESMKTTLLTALSALALIMSGPVNGWTQEVIGSSDQPVEARIWLDRGVDPVLQQGDRARVYYRVSVDAYLLLFHINTDGVLRLLFPGGTEEVHLARGGRDYRLLFPESDEWLVNEDPGVGYFFVLASEEPFSFERLSRVSVAGGWDSSPDHNRIQSDPYVTVDDFRRVLLPGGGERSYAIDFTAYHVDQSYSYPRFLCYQCHVELPVEQWNPYHQTCLDVRVVIYNDPYYYPATRYQGERVVYARPPEPGLPQFAFRQRRIGEMGTPLVESRITALRASPSQPSLSGGVWTGGSELVRNVDQTGTTGQTMVRNPLLQGSPTDAVPGVSARPRRSGFLSTVFPTAPERERGASQPILRRRNADDRVPLPR